MFPGLLPLSKATVSSSAWSWDWQSLTKLLEPNWLTREGSRAGDCLQEPPSPRHPLQKLLGRWSDAAAEGFCAFGGSPLCWLCSVELVHGDEDGVMCLGCFFAAYLGFLGGMRIPPILKDAPCSSAAGQGFRHYWACSQQPASCPRCLLVIAILFLPCMSCQTS